MEYEVHRRMKSGFGKIAFDRARNYLTIQRDGSGLRKKFPESILGTQYYAFQKHARSKGGEKCLRHSEICLRKL